MTETFGNVREYLNKMSNKETGSATPKAQSLLTCVNTFYDLVASLNTGDLQSFQSKLDFLKETKDGGFKPALREFFAVHGYKTLDDNSLKLINSMTQIVNNMDNVFFTYMRQIHIVKLGNDINKLNADEAKIEKQGRLYVDNCLINGVDPKNPKAQAEKIRNQIVQLKAQNNSLLDSSKHINIDTPTSKRKAELIEQKTKVYEALSACKSRMLMCDKVELYAREIDENIKKAAKITHDNADEAQFLKAANESIEDQISELNKKKSEASKAKAEINDLIFSEDGELIERVEKNKVVVDRLNAAFETLEELEKITEQNGIDLRSLYAKTEGGLKNLEGLSETELAVLNMYNGAKKSFISYFDDAKQQFEMDEIDINTVDPIPQSFLNGSGKQFKQQLNTMLDELDNDYMSETYLNYTKLQAKVYDAEGCDKAIRDLEMARKVNNMKIDFLFKQNTDKIADIKAQKNYLTDNGLTVEPFNLEEIRSQIDARRGIFGLDFKNIQRKIDSIDSEIAKQTAIEKNQLDALAAKIENNCRQISELETKAAVIDNFTNTRDYLKREQESLVSSCCDMAGQGTDLLPEAVFGEVAMKFGQIKAHLLDKSNGKMSTEFREMYESLNDLIKNLANSDSEQAEQGLRDLQEKTNKYIDAKNSQFRPKFLSSEQRFVRLQGALDISELIPSAYAMIAKNVTKETQVASLNFVENNLIRPSISPDDMLNQKIVQPAIQNSKVSLRQQPQTRQVENVNPVNNPQVRMN